jgi:formylglycine-generating enzyme required for sulfatase activity
MSEESDFLNKMGSVYTNQAKDAKRQLDTLLFTYSATLSRYPALQAELKAATQSGLDLDVKLLLQRYEPALQHANAFALEQDLLEPAVAAHSKMQQFLGKAEAALTTSTVAGLLQKLQALTAEVERQLAQAQQAPPEPKAEPPAPKILIPEMVALPRGKFTMGCVKGRDDVEGGGYSDENSAHEVSIDAFSIGKFPVTFAEFDCFCAATGFTKPFDCGWGRDNRPVIDVSWNDAQAYINWLNRETEGGWRLTTEAEWEYAARGNGEGAYPWGQAFNSRYANAGNVHAQTTVVGSYPPNAFGLFDMHGNVWEWCHDPWHGNYQGAPTDGSVWAGGESNLRIVRGGSWRRSPGNARSAYRCRCGPARQVSALGFRLARSIRHG